MIDKSDLKTDPQGINHTSKKEAFMIDINKKYQTREGKEVRIFMTDGRQPYPVMGAVNHEDGWYPKSWDIEGKFYKGEEHWEDLVEVKVKKTRQAWVNIYPIEAEACIHASLDGANAAADEHRIACVPVTLEWEE
jgi:hypothetical protein